MATIEFDDFMAIQSKSDAYKNLKYQFEKLLAKGEDHPLATDLIKNLSQFFMDITELNDILIIDYLFLLTTYGFYESPYFKPRTETVKAALKAITLNYEDLYKFENRGKHFSDFVKKIANKIPMNEKDFVYLYYVGKVLEVSVNTIMEM